MRVRQWLKRRWCIATSHNWQIMDLPPKRRKTVLYCKRCTEARLVDPNNPGVFWFGDGYRVRKLRRMLPKAQVRKL